MDASATEPTTSSSRAVDKKYYRQGEAKNIALPVTKISLPNLTTVCHRRDFLPVIVAMLVFASTFFVGQRVGSLFWPESLFLGQTVSILGQKSLTSVGTVGKKITQNIKATKKTISISLPSSDPIPINVPEPSLAQSWRELVASASVGGSKLSLFGEQLWDVLANKTAYTVDWLAYGAVGSQEKMVETINDAKVSISGRVGGSLKTISTRVASSSVQIKKTTLAMSNQAEILDDFDQTTTAYLSRLIRSLGQQFMSLGQKTKNGLIGASLSARNLPGDTLLGVSELFWQPLADKTNNLASKTLLMVDLTRVGLGIATEKGTQSFIVFSNIISRVNQITTKIGFGLAQVTIETGSTFFNNTKIGYQYVADQAGQTSSQVAAIKFLGAADSSKEFFVVIKDRIITASQGMVSFLSNLWQTAVKNWKIFFGLTAEREASQVIASKIDNTTLSGLEEKIKNDLRNDLRKEIADVIQRTSANNLSDKSNQGLVVVPSTGDQAEDEKIKNDIQKMFSDRVTISLDANRKAGVVTPVFNPSENYIFLLTPVKK
ncbi:MAG: hypothetical protein UW57_C0020G0003 [Candidatus Giovannonibacteria bacterium GW2011_GWA1_44_29]|uniref:Uncharacterized protein n=1 Tax=Candidatus Giovannonibacteria bacterium GW2011_GWA1_44_29 TaxID=1618646 RepID=A0A0G1LQN8_9BACT|nr:MAG: hypothetical protein UW57_C0020G0003 [Candidatus Giovannonibacteria bacterium GW2011_GWA1_44_29]